MNEIHKIPLQSIGYNFVPGQYLPEGKDEYHLRNQQNRSGINYRNLTAYEIEVLVRNNNTSDDWNKIQVSDAFNPELVKHCKFYGLVRIGKLETIAIEYHNVRMPVGLYNSTVISCDFGDNVVINNVNYMSHYIIGNEVMIANVHELHVTDHAKFGNGIIKEGEDEAIRIWVEVCNENAGRKIIPFNGMLAGDAYLWSKYRDRKTLMQRFKEFAEKKFDKQRGYYGKVGDRSVIKNTSIIKDVWIGSDAYIKGANKLKNLTINSQPGAAATQIGEGCEIVNGIIGFGCRVFYGVKAVRFIMGSHSQLKYGARLINSYLGDNSTISCCEVLNSLIFPAHEQHHNNSFLCAALVMGQSNIAAGATIGSNHNSRAADGEMIAARGFWPGLCVSLKHNSRFASFSLLAKGDYPAELNIPLPFSLISNDITNNQLVVMPGYWFMYNLYALARNAGKYVDRDKRHEKIQHIEYDYLAPDSVNEILEAMNLLCRFTAMANGTTGSNEELVQAGKTLLEDANLDINSLDVKAYGFEAGSRPTKLIKVKEGYKIYKQLVIYYGCTELLKAIEKGNFQSFSELVASLPSNLTRSEWINIGGQLFSKVALQNFLKTIEEGSVDGWDAVHQFYIDQGTEYPNAKKEHAWASLLEVLNSNALEFTDDRLKELLQEIVTIKERMYQNIYESRSKDYQSAFRKLVYDNDAEMEEVIGKLEDNIFIKQQEEEVNRLKKMVSDVRKKFKL